MSGRLLSGSVVFGCIGFMSICTPVLADIDLLFAPTSQEVAVDATVLIDVIAKSSTDTPEQLTALDAIIEWDPSLLELVDFDLSTSPHTWTYGGFLPNVCGLNEGIDEPQHTGIPNNDGDAAYTALGNVASSPMVGPEGMVVSTLEFRALAQTTGTDVVYLPEVVAGLQTCVTQVFGTGTGNDVTGDLSSVSTVTIWGSQPGTPGVPDGEAGYDKIRYISIVPSEPGVQTALRVTLTDMPAPFDAFEGLQMWVGTVVEKCENGGVSDPPCPPVPLIPDSYQSANLQCTPHCMDFGSVGALHVTDDEIISNAVYDVQAIDCNADFGVEENYSDPLTIGTSVWADLVKDCTTIPCGPPDGNTGIVDVTAILDKFKNLPAAVMKSRADIDPNLPDWLVNITDVTFCLDAFLGFTYPPPGWTGPGGCPP